MMFVLLNLYPVCEKATHFSLEVDNKPYPLPAPETLTLPKRTEIATPPSDSLRLTRPDSSSRARQTSGGGPPAGAPFLRQAGTAVMFQNSLHSLAGRVTNVASNVTSTVKELATEVMDNEREYKREREEVKASAARPPIREAAVVPPVTLEPAATRLPPPPTTAMMTKTMPGPPPPPPSRPASNLDSLKTRLEKDKSRATRQHELLERIRAAKKSDAPTVRTAEPKPPPVPPVPMDTIARNQTQPQPQQHEERRKIAEEEPRVVPPPPPPPQIPTPAPTIPAVPVPTIPVPVPVPPSAETLATIERLQNQLTTLTTLAEERKALCQTLQEDLLSNKSVVSTLRQEKDRLQRHLLEIEADQDDRMAHYEDKIRQLEERDSETNTLRDEVLSLKAAVDSKTYEVVNLQAALGQLTADSELCSKYRTDIQRLESRIQGLEGQAEGARGDAGAMAEARDAAVREVAAAQAEKEALFQETIQVKQENIKLRQALHELLEKKKTEAQESDQIDRRIVMKLLATYLEKGRTWEVMEVMGGILGWTTAEKTKIHQLANGKGVLKTVAKTVATPLSMAGDAIGQAKVPESDSSLGELWIQFLSDSTLDDQTSP